MRPKLSMHGFDETDGTALGVKQVLGLAFGAGGFTRDDGDASSSTLANSARSRRASEPDRGKDRLR